MSFNARWGGIKIVEPSTSSRAEELVGGLRNAFERGESFIKAKQSLINAGYNPAEVELATQEMRRLLSSKNPPKVAPVEKNPAPTVKKKSIFPIKKPQVKQLPKASKVPSSKKNGISTALMIILIIVMVLILVGATVLGLFWDQWF